MLSFDRPLNRVIDHTMINADALPQDIEALCEEVKKYNFATAAVNPCHVKRCAKLLRGTESGVVCAIGFPFGVTTKAIKVAETKEALDNGATEIDMVINIGELKAHNDAYVFDEIAAVVSAAEVHQHIVKVIIETDYLTEEEKIRASKLILKAGANFIKTSTGTRKNGATVEDIRLILRAVDNKLQVKAAGGIRSFETAEAMILAGATRLGTSSSVKIMQEAQSQLEMRSLQ